MADHNQTVTLSVEARDEFRAKPIYVPTPAPVASLLYSYSTFGTPAPSANQDVDALAGWHGTYGDAHDQGMTMLAKFSRVLGFTVEKRVVRA